MVSQHYPRRHRHPPPRFRAAPPRRCRVSCPSRRSGRCSVRPHDDPAPGRFREAQRGRSGPRRDRRQHRGGRRARARRHRAGPQGRILAALPVRRPERQPCRAVRVAGGRHRRRPRALFLGLSPVHINYTIQGLRRGGLIERRGTSFEVLDRERLQVIADFDPAYLRLDRCPCLQRRTVDVRAVTP